MLPMRNLNGGRMLQGRAEAGGPRPLSELVESFLERCRGEGPANCVSRCPIGVDARGYVQLAASGRFREALQLVRRRLPFPGVLGYVCSHPCEQYCKRIDSDGPVRVRDIKRFLAEWEPGPPRHIVDCDDDRPEAVAVVGSGPAGLMAAHDLRRLGYRVTIFEREARIGGCLTGRIPAWRLPRAVVERDLTVIDALAIEVRTRTGLGTEIELVDLTDAFDAVILALGFAGAIELGAGRTVPKSTRRGTLWVDPSCWQTSEPKVYAVGDAVTGPSTVVEALAVGRQLAAALHRGFAGQTAVDGGPSPVPRPLMWALEVDETERASRVRTPLALGPVPDALSEDEVREEADRCLDCSCRKCVEACDFLSAYCESPRDIARRAGGDLGGHLRMVYSCALCSLCREVCPVDLDVGQLLHAARREAVRRSLAPLRRHRRLLRTLRLGCSESLTLAMPEPGRRRAPRLFFPGCALAAASPKMTIELYQRVRSLLPRTGVLLTCCGAPADAIGLETGADAATAWIEGVLDRLETEELLVACPDCGRYLKSRLPDVVVRTVWEVLAEEGGSGDPVGQVFLHDPCRARYDVVANDAVRALLARHGIRAIAGDDDRDYAGCCGSGGGLAAVDRRLARRFAARHAAPSSAPMVVACVGCRAAFSRVRPEVHHVLEPILGMRLGVTARPGAEIGWTGWLNRWRTRAAFERLRPLGAG